MVYTNSLGTVPSLNPPPTLRQRTTPTAQAPVPSRVTPTTGTTVPNPVYTPTSTGRPSMGARTSALGQRLRPTSKASQIILMNVGVILLMALIYTIWLWVQPEAWNTPLGDGEEFSVFDKLINGLYVSIVTHTTVGFGDFFPLSLPAKILVMIHGMLVFYVNLFMGLS